MAEDDTDVEEKESAKIRILKFVLAGGAALAVKIVVENAIDKVFVKKIEEAEAEAE